MSELDKFLNLEMSDELIKKLDLIDLFNEKYDLENILTILNDKQMSLTIDSYNDIHISFEEVLSDAVWNKDEMCLEWALVMRLFIEKLIGSFSNRDEFDLKLKTLLHGN